MGTPSITSQNSGRDDLGLGGLDHAPEQGVVRRLLGAAVHQAGEAELQLMLKFQATPSVEHPEARRPLAQTTGHGAVRELDVKTSAG